MVIAAARPELCRSSRPLPAPPGAAPAPAPGTATPCAGHHRAATLAPVTGPRPAHWAPRAEFLRPRTGPGKRRAGQGVPATAVCSQEREPL